MSAQRIVVATVDYPDPNSSESKRRKADFVSHDVSLRYRISNNIRTLSSKNADVSNGPAGSLYVPDLQSADCKQAEEEHVPKNATRLQQLPSGDDYTLVALAPWFSQACMIQYFESARRDKVQAFLVYQPLNRSPAEMPPPMSDASWLLRDGGRWKSDNNFPTYAIMPVSGNTTVHELAHYSGNISEVPHSTELSSSAYDYAPGDYIRLYASIETDTGNRLPSLWVFLVIVLGLLILVVFSTSGFMHFVQRRRREDLRRRVINGEVNLEAVGVKRLTVPQRFVDKMPLYTYSGPGLDDAEKATLQVPPQAHPVPSPRFDLQSNARRAPLFRRSSAPSAPVLSADPTPAFSQPTCPICLDDFEPQETQVRELPCRHIYHPDCIDTFLLNNSSLCPMCKKSVLPSGYCPTKITNVMVRRERILRRMQSRHPPPQAASHPPSHPQNTPSPGPLGSLGSRIGGAIVGRRVFSAPLHSRLPSADIEMGASNAPPSSSTGTESVPSGVTAASATNPTPATRDCVVTPTTNRNEWVRQRALTLLGNRPLPAGAENEEDSGPRWRRVARKVFPGFR